MFILRQFPKNDHDFENVEEYTSKTFDELGRIVLYKNIKYQWFAYEVEAPYDYKLMYSKISASIVDQYNVDEIVYSSDYDNKCKCGVDSMGPGRRHSWYCGKYT